MNAKTLVSVAWGLSAAVVIVAVMAWGQGMGWQFEGLSTYSIFPLFGLLAFSLMWAHYVVAAARTHFKIDSSVTKQYFEVTSLAVLAFILLHPGLLAWQLWRDGAGLPPSSELNYLGPDLKMFILLGMIAWVIFLAYEFRRQFKTRPWWKYVQYANDGAMVLILIHSLKIGSNLQQGWLKGVWYFYAVGLAGSLAYIYYKKLTPKPKEL